MQSGKQRLGRSLFSQDFLLLLPVSSPPVSNSQLAACLPWHFSNEKWKKRKRKGANCLGMRHKICIWAI